MNNNIKVDPASSADAVDVKTNEFNGVHTPEFKIQDGNIPLTAFGDLRTAELSPIFQGTFEYTVNNTDINTINTINGGAVTQDNAMACVSTSTTTASQAMLESKTHARYRAGLGALCRFTAMFTSGVADTEQYVGFSGEHGTNATFNNGLVVGFDGEDFGFHRFSNDEKFSIVQSAWDDPLDGSGPSGMTLLPNRLNVWAIGYEYLGSGPMTLFIVSDSAGLFVPVHTIRYTNKFEEPSSHNPNYFFHIHANNKATTSDLIIKSSSYGYFIEGKTQFTENQQPQFSTNFIGKAGITTEEAIVTIRVKSNYISKTNFIDIIMERLVCSSEASSANNLSQIRLVKNATLAGTPSYNDINATNSIVEFDIAGTTVTGGEHVLTAPMAGKNDEGTENLIPYKVTLQAGDTLTAAGTSVGTATMNAEMLWKELF